MSTAPGVIINRVQPITGVTVPIFILDTNSTGIASNRNDHLIYYVPSSGTGIRGFDPTPSSIAFTYFPFGSISTIGLPGGYSISGIGYDQTRNFLYTTPSVGNVIGQIAPRPYDRYGAPGSQSFTSAPLTITGSPIAITTLWYDITVEPETGYCYSIVANGGIFSIVKFSPFSTTVLASANVIGPLVQPYAIAHSNDGNIYYANGLGTLFVITDTSTLTSIATGGTTFANPLDFSDPLYNN